jgi:hypothetical protein
VGVSSTGQRRRAETNGSGGAAQAPAHELAGWIAKYYELLAQGYATQPPPRTASGPRRGLSKQPPAKNLLDALLGQGERVLAFLADLRAYLADDAQTGPRHAGDARHRLPRTALLRGQGLLS